MNIKEDYVSFEVAKLLKEKGFDEKCRESYDKDGNFLFHKNCYFQLECGDGYLVPTHQMACKWLREVHNIMIEIYLPHEYKNEDEELWNGTYCYELYSLKTGHSVYWDEKEFNSYEEAVEAALKYVLENSI